MERPYPAQHGGFFGSITVLSGARLSAQPQKRARTSGNLLAVSLSQPPRRRPLGFVRHAFISPLRGGYLCPCPGLARLYLLFPLNQNRQTTQARKNLCCLKKIQRHHIYFTALGQVTLSPPGLFCVQTHSPHSRFFTEGRGSRGRNYTG